MKNTTILFFIMAIIVLAGSFVFVKGKAPVTGNTIVEPQALQGETQKVVLSQEGFNYKDVRVEAGKPIEISADDSVRGCLRAAVFNIEGKKYSKYLRTPQDTMILPALKKGTYTFSCTMGMGFGKMVAV